MNVLVDDAELARRREVADSDPGGWKPERERAVSGALRAYASMVSSADRGAVRLVESS